MSHFSRLRSQFVDKEILVATLRDMNLSPQVAGKKLLVVKDYDGQPQKVDIAVFRQHWGGRSDIGFKLNKETGAYEVVADFWDVESKWKGLIAYGREGAGGEIAVNYARNVNLRKLEAEGFKLDSEQVIDGVLTITMVRQTQRTTAQSKTTTRSIATRHNRVGR